MNVGNLSFMLEGGAGLVNEVMVKDTERGRRSPRNQTYISGVERGAGASKGDRNSQHVYSVQ